MKQCQTIFKRKEEKYLLSDKQLADVMQALAEHVKPDDFGKYAVSSVYYDTDDFLLIRQSLYGPLYKEKLRLRYYGVPGCGSTVFMEIKKKYSGTVYKRRIPLHFEDVGDLRKNAMQLKGDNQIGNEIFWFFERYHPKPKVVIVYDRIALVEKEDPNLRITFDSNINWQPVERCTTCSGEGTPLIPGQHIMEIKSLSAMPIWLTHALNEREIYPTSFSKYGTCFSQYLSQGKEEKRYVS